MKTFGKLKTNPEKVIKNEELENFKGGDIKQAVITCKNGSQILGNLYVSNCYYPSPDSQCTAVWPSSTSFECNAW